MSVDGRGFDRLLLAGGGGGLEGERGFVRVWEGVF